MEKNKEKKSKLFREVKGDFSKGTVTDEKEGKKTTAADLYNAAGCEEQLRKLMDKLTKEKNWETIKEVIVEAFTMIRCIEESTSVNKVVNDSPDSVEIGTPAKGGAVKCYGSFGKPEDFKKKIKQAFEVRKFAQELKEKQEAD